MNNKESFVRDLKIDYDYRRRTYDFVFTLSGGIVLLVPISIDDVGKGKLNEERLNYRVIGAAASTFGDQIVDLVKKRIRESVEQGFLIIDQ